MQNTLKNLEKTTGMEIIDNKIYNTYAALARKEGFLNISNSLREIAKDKEIFYKRFNKLINKIKNKSVDGFDHIGININVHIDLEKNLRYVLRDSINQIREHLITYKNFLEIAKREDLAEVVTRFRELIEIEKNHINELKLLCLRLTAPKIYKKMIHTD